MKIKNVIITVATIGVLTAGGIIVARHFGVGSSSSSKVEVIPVSMLNTNWFDDEEGNTIEGMIVSRDTQNVRLNDEYELTDVYVHTGDEVRKGDPLISYDMTMLQLQLEVSELKSQMLDLDLAREERELEKLMKKPGASALIAKIEQSTEAQKTKSEDEPGNSGDGLGEGGGLVSVDELPEETLTGDLGDPDLGGLNQDDVSSDNDPAMDEEPVFDDLEDFDQSGDEELIEDEEQEQDPDLFNDGTYNDAPDVQYSDGGEESLLTEEEGLYNTYARLRLYITDFLTQEELMTDYAYKEYIESGDVSVFNPQDIADAISTFEKYIAAEPSKEKRTVQEFVDAFGNTRNENVYLLSGDTWLALEELRDKQAKEGLVFYPETAALNLYKGYLYVTAYDLIVKMHAVISALSQMDTDAYNATPEQAASIRAQIVAAADAYYKFDVNRKVIMTVLELDFQLSDEELKAMDTGFQALLTPISGSNMTLSDSTEGALSMLIAKLNTTDVLQETEAITETKPSFPEAITEPDWDGLDYGDDFDDIDDDEDDEETLEESLRNARSNVKNAKLNIRENEIKVKELKRKLSGQTVKSQMDGVVKSAGEADGSSDEDNFIIITGESGMYLEGSVGELELETLHEGDQITGQSEDTGAFFTATITEISGYPENNDDSFSFYGWSSEPKNNNVSNYPFTAYIEDADELTEGMARVTLPTEKKNSGIALDPAYVRTDEQGREYVMAADENNLLTKKYVTTTMSYGSVMIKSGLTEEDRIAFPYGKNVVEGAQTVDSDGYDSTYV